MGFFYQPGQEPKGIISKKKMWAILIFSACIISFLFYLLLCNLLPPGLSRGLHYYNKGNRYAAEGRYEEAKRSYQKAIKVSPHSLLSYCELADINLREGRCEEALKSLNQAKNLAPDEPIVYLKLIKVYGAMGMEDKAEECRARYEELRKEF